VSDAKPVIVMPEPLVPPLPSYEREYRERQRMLKGYRGRRFLACRAADTLHDVCGALASDDGSDLPLPDRPLPTPPSAAEIRELQNAVALILRMILLRNDGCISPQELRRF